MTFARVKPAGWTDDITTITAAELNGLDINQSRAIDGNAGGTYTPSGALAINGSAGFSIGASNTTTLAAATSVTGVVTVSGNNAAVAWRVYNATNASETIEGARYDIIKLPATITANRTYTIAAASPVPATGHILRVVRATDDIASTAPSATYTAAVSFGGAATVIFQASKWGFIHFFYSGSEWIPIAWSPTAIDVPGAIADSWA